MKMRRVLFLLVLFSLAAHGQILTRQVTAGMDIPAARPVMFQTPCGAVCQAITQTGSSPAFGISQAAVKAGQPENIGTSGELVCEFDSPPQTGYTAVALNGYCHYDPTIVNDSDVCSDQSAIGRIQALRPDMGPNFGTVNFRGIAARGSKLCASSPGMTAAVRAVQSTSAGPKGDTGNVGPQGAKGDIGLTGAAGPIGATGSVGAMGATGAQGLQGVAGTTGLTGPAGAAGIAGQAGPVGPKGDTGAVGNTGPQGVPGNTGLTGNTGAQGATGAQGVKGDAGAIGATGPMGATGAAGAQGLPGSQGLQGVAGPVGLTGATGPQGIQGFPGQTGATGPSGSPGYLSGTSTTVTQSLLTIGSTATGTASIPGVSAGTPCVAASINTPNPNLNIYAKGTAAGVATVYQTNLVVLTTAPTSTVYNIRCMP